MKSKTNLCKYYSDQPVYSSIPLYLLSKVVEAVETYAAAAEAEVAAGAVTVGAVVDFVAARNAVAAAGAAVVAGTGGERSAAAAWVDGQKRGGGCRAEMREEV